MKKLGLVLLAVLSMAACTNRKVVDYNTARLDVIEEYLREHKMVKVSEELEALKAEGKIGYEEAYQSLEREAKAWKENQ